MNPLPATLWALNHSGLIGLKIKKYRWAEKFDLHDFGVDLSVNGKMGIGRGTDTNQALALEKAIAEAIERIFSSAFYSNQAKKVVAGFAVHPDPNSAKTIATDEFYEKSIFFRNYFLSKPEFKSQIDLSELANDANEYHSEFIKSFNENSIRIYEFYDSIRLRTMTLCYQRARNGARYLGTSYGSPCKENILRSVIEVYRNFFFDQLNHKTRVRFSDLKERQISEKEIFAPFFDSWLDSGSVVKTKKFQKRFNDNELKLHRLVVPLNYIFDCPLYASVAFEEDGLCYSDDFSQIIYMGQFKWNPLI